MDGSTSIYVVDESASSSSVPPVLNGHAQVLLQGVNQLIDDLEVVTQATKEGLERELYDAREQSELLLLQLHQVQEELEYYFLENRRKDIKLQWLLGQVDILRRLLRLQVRFQRRLMALYGRIALPSLRRQLMPWWQGLRRS
jgi:hypothetical protein